MVSPVHELHLAEHLKVPEVTEGMSPKEALAVAIKRSEGLCRFYQSLVKIQPEGEIRRRLEYLPRAESSHMEKGRDLRYGSLSRGVVRLDEETVRKYS